jgi:CheY-like chemotaxis protein
LSANFLLSGAAVHRLERTKTPSSYSRSSVLASAPMASAGVAHVLIADANPRSRAVRAQQCTAAGCRVSIAQTAFEAIVKASCHIPDVILLDGSLAGLDAATACELLTTCPTTAHIPVFTLTPGRRVPQRVLDATTRQLI